MNDILGPHMYQARQREEFKRKLHDDRILMKVETIYGSDDKEVIKSVNVLTYSTDLF